MIFPSYVFLLAFLPLVLSLWHGLRSLTLRLVVLTVASYVFYGWWDPRFCALMLGSTLLDYVCGKYLYRATTERARRGWLTLSLAGNLGALGFFKYFDFFAASLASLLDSVGIAMPAPALHVILPVGISFYTFQSMSYSLDIYKGTCRPSRDFLRFAAYVAMFPQLVAGPIVRYEQIAAQLDGLETKRSTADEIVEGIWMFSIGLVKKIWIADLLAPMADACFDSGEPPGLVRAWTGTLAYTFQLYYDFSGYSDMAIGLGLLLGFRFPINFASPYQAASIQEFWNRWHISLSHWLRDYLYFPLGGSQRGRAITLRNLGITMFLGGLWHGAGWTFVFWGLYHGALLIAHALWRQLTTLRVPRPAGVLLTFLAVMVGWVFFRAPDFTTAWQVLAGLVGLGGLEPMSMPWRFGIMLPSALEGFGVRAVGLLTVASAIAFLAPASQDLRRPRHWSWALALGVVVLATLTRLMDETPFLYFRF